VPASGFRPALLRSRHTASDRETPPSLSLAGWGLIGQPNRDPVMCHVAYLPLWNSGVAGHLRNLGFFRKSPKSGCRRNSRSTAGVAFAITAKARASFLSAAYLSTARGSLSHPPAPTAGLRDLLLRSTPSEARFTMILPNFKSRWITPLLCASANVPETRGRPPLVAHPRQPSESAHPCRRIVYEVASR